MAYILNLEGSSFFGFKFPVLVSLASRSGLRGRGLHEWLLCPSDDIVHLIEDPSMGRNAS